MMLLNLHVYILFHLSSIFLLQNLQKFIIKNEKKKCMAFKREGRRKLRQKNRKLELNKKIIIIPFDVQMRCQK